LRWDVISLIIYEIEVLTKSPIYRYEIWDTAKFLIHRNMCDQKFGQSYRMRGINKRSLKNDWEGKDIIMKVWHCNQSLIIVIVGAKLLLLLLLVLLRATNLLMWLYRTYFQWIIAPIINTSRSAIKRLLYFCPYFSEYIIYAISTFFQIIV
jgi:hypothetical protein